MGTESVKATGTSANVDYMSRFRNRVVVLEISEDIARSSLFDNLDSIDREQFKKTSSFFRTLHVSLQGATPHDDIYPGVDLY